MATTKDQDSKEVEEAAKLKEKSHEDDLSESKAGTKNHNNEESRSSVGGGSEPGTISNW